MIKFDKKVSMAKRMSGSKSQRELIEAILNEKRKGTSDLEIGQKYGVNFRYIERLITKTEGISVSTLKVSKRIKRLRPKDFEEEDTTFWSFKQRGDWATHSGEYRGNWSPYIPRNVILKYSKPGELVLDYFCGGGTTAIECKLLGRRCIAMDINERAIELARKNLDFPIKEQQLSFDEESNLEIYEPELRVGDARDLSFLEDNSVDLICSHPPYANIIHYTNSKEGDLSFLDIDDFLEEMSKVAKESFRVLKPGRKCAILIGDTRRKRYIVPLGFKLIDVYLGAGFKLKELVIKQQHNCKTTGFWYERSIKYNFLLLAHEYLPVFEKPATINSLNVREGGIDYYFPPSSKATSFKKKLDKLETTTIWKFPVKDFEERLNKNVIERYSNGEDCLVIVPFESPGIKFGGKMWKENGKLLFIKFPFLKGNPSYLFTQHYLNEIKTIVDEELPNMKKDGFLVIQTKDVRIDGYVEPLAKKIIDTLTYDNLWLKEIVVAVPEGAHSKMSNSTDYLKIVHQYLLVYEVKK